MKTAAKQTANVEHLLECEGRKLLRGNKIIRENGKLRYCIQAGNHGRFLPLQW